MNILYVTWTRAPNHRRAPNHHWRHAHRASPSPFSGLGTTAQWARLYYYLFGFLSAEWGASLLSNSNGTATGYVSHVRTHYQASRHLGALAVGNAGTRPGVGGLWTFHATCPAVRGASHGGGRCMLAEPAQWQCQSLAIRSRVEWRQQATRSQATARTVHATSRRTGRPAVHPHSAWREILRRYRGMADA